LEGLVDQERGPDHGFKKTDYAHAKTCGNADEIHRRADET